MIRTLFFLFLLFINSNILASDRIINSHLIFGIVKDGVEYIGIDVTYNLENPNKHQFVTFLYDDTKYTLHPKSIDADGNRYGNVKSISDITDRGQNQVMRLLFPVSIIHPYKGNLNYFLNVNMLDCSTGNYIDRGDFLAFSMKGTESTEPRRSPLHSPKPAVNIPRTRESFHHLYTNRGGVCLLACYAHMLEFANSTKYSSSKFDYFDVMASILQYHNTLEPIKQYSAEDFRKNQYKCETVLSKAVNNYCGQRNWSGFRYIENYHNWLKQNSEWLKDTELEKRYSGDYNTTSPIPGIYDTLCSKLSQNGNPNSTFDYVSLIIFKMPGMFHGSLLGFDGDYFIRDPNFSNPPYKIGRASFDFEFVPDAEIVDYMLFKIKRP